MIGHVFLNLYLFQIPCLHTYVLCLLECLADRIYICTLDCLHVLQFHMFYPFIHRCKSATFRWPVVAFYHILDCAGLNGYVIYSHREENRRLRSKTDSRQKFWMELATELIKPHIRARAASVRGLSQNTRRAMAVTLGCLLT